jgi:hypothetical protein
MWLYSALQRRAFNPAAYAYNTLLVLRSIGVLGYINFGKNKRVKRRSEK